MIKLTASEKQEYMNIMADYLPSMRKLLRLSQTDYSALCGVSRARISAIECKDVKMTWYQFSAFLAVFLMNKETRRMILNLHIFPDRLFAYYQNKKEGDTMESLTSE